MSLRDDRANHLNLIRMSAACAVLVYHSFALTRGLPAVKPPDASLPVTLGSIAVDVFFVISGFLVTRSLLTKGNLPDFILARSLRILPGLLAVLALTVLVLGPALTTAPLADYFGSPVTWAYLGKGATLFFGVDHTLPGVFTTNPYPHSVNGSLWTLPYEARMYALLAALWWGLGLLGQSRERLIRPAIVCAAVVSGAALLTQHFIQNEPQHFTRLFFMFFGGGAFFCLRDRIPLSGRTAVLIAAVVMLSTVHREVFYVAYNAGIGYIVLVAAFVPKGPALKYGALGDYSYGMYLYAFPMQQLVMLLPGIGPWTLVGAAGVLTLACAVLSWHFIERPALALRRRAARPVLDPLAAAAT